MHGYNEHIHCFYRIEPVLDNFYQLPMEMPYKNIIIIFMYGALFYR